MIDLRLGDCLEIMKTIPDRSIDLVLTDPPYGVNKANWDDVFPNENYWKEIQRLLKSDILVFTGEAFLPYKLNLLSKFFNYEWTLAWYKPNAMQFGKTGYTVQSLIFWFSVNSSAKPKIRDVIVKPIIPQENNFGHPSPKPLQVIKKLILEYSNEENLILDPFMGSGTTGVVAKELGRNFIGIEINPEYFKLSERRIAEATKELFI